MKKMIQANELRIGNEINKGVVVEIHKDGVKVFNGLHYYENEIFPIPLSPEILEKCGFKNVQGDYWMKDNELMLALDSVWWWTNSWEPDGEFGFSALATYKEIESLHQLQNLYYALTGTELIYKP